MSDRLTRAAEPRWFMRCPKCGFRRSWTGSQSDVPACSECAKKATAVQPRTGGVRLAPPADDGPDETLDLIDEAMELIEELPERAYDFGVSVSEKLSDIRDSIVKRGSATPSQHAACGNMLHGIQKWIH